MKPSQRVLARRFQSTLNETALRHGWNIETGHPTCYAANFSKTLDDDSILSGTIYESGYLAKVKEGEGRILAFAQCNIKKLEQRVTGLFGDQFSRPWGKTATIPFGCFAPELHVPPLGIVIPFDETLEASLTKIGTRYFEAVTPHLEAISRGEYFETPSPSMLELEGDLQWELRRALWLLEFATTRREPGIVLLEAKARMLKWIDYILVLRGRIATPESIAAKRTELLAECELIVKTLGSTPSLGNR